MDNLWTMSELLMGHILCALTETAYFKDSAS